MKGRGGNRSGARTDKVRQGRRRLQIEGESSESEDPAGMGRYGPRYSPASVASSVSDDLGRRDGPIRPTLQNCSPASVVSSVSDDLGRRDGPIRPTLQRLLVYWLKLGRPGMPLGRPPGIAPFASSFLASSFLSAKNSRRSLRSVSIPHLSIR